MNLQLIRAALDTRLSTWADLPPVAWEGQDFAPTDGVTYAAVNLLPNRPDNPTLTESLIDAGGVYQVSLYFPRGADTGVIDALAGSLVAHFTAGLSLVAATIRVRVVGTPAITAGIPTGDRWLVPVSVRYRCLTQGA